MSINEIDLDEAMAHSAGILAAPSPGSHDYFLHEDGG